MTLSDLMRPEGVTVFAVIRGNDQTGSWLDLGTTSYTAAGAADIADTHPGPKEWKAANRPQSVVPLTLSLAPDAKRMPIPSTPSRRARS